MCGLYAAIPYTVFLLLIGIATTAINSLVEESFLKDSIEQHLINMPPELIIFVFLPSLLFGESMHINFYQVKSIAWSSLLLVGPGCLLGTYAMAALAYSIFPYDWSWNLCCAFGGDACIPYF